MNIRIIVGGVAALLIGVGVFIAISVSGDDLGEIESMIALEGQKTEEPAIVSQDQHASVELEEFDPLIDRLEGVEIEGFYNKFSYIYGAYFPEIVGMAIEVDEYYEMHSDRLSQLLGIETYEAYHRLYNKIARVPNYDKCEVKLNSQSIDQKDSVIYFDITVTYDDQMKMNYYLTMDLTSQQLTIE